MPIKRKRLPKAEPSPKKVEIPTMVIGDDDATRDKVTRYLRATAAKKAAEDRIKTLRPALENAFLEELIYRNVNERPEDPLTSLKVVDNRGSAVTMSFTKKYAAGNADAIDEAMAEIGLDSGDFVEEVYTAEVDWKPFEFKGVKGSFNDSLFRRFVREVAAVAEKLGLPSNPLSLGTKVRPKPDFHTERWAEVPDAEQQRELVKILPNTINILTTAQQGESE